MVSQSVVLAVVIRSLLCCLVVLLHLRKVLSLVLLGRMFRRLVGCSVDLKVVLLVLLVMVLIGCPEGLGLSTAILVFQ